MDPLADIIHVHSNSQKWAEARKLLFRSGLQMHQLDEETLNGVSSFYTKSVGLLYFTRGSCNKPKPTFHYWIQPRNSQKNGFSDVSDIGTTDSFFLLSSFSWNRCWFHSSSHWHNCFTNASFGRLNDKHHHKNQQNSSFADLNFFRIKRALVWGPWHAYTVWKLGMWTFESPHSWNGDVTTIFEKVWQT